MNLDKCFEEITNYAHFWNWLPEWEIVKKIYNTFPDSYSVLTPFAYSYLEELIRTMTSDYLYPINYVENGKVRKKIVGYKLVDMAIKENDNVELKRLLNDTKKYFKQSEMTDHGENRNSVSHAYTHPNVWDKSSFEKLIVDIAELSKYAKF